MQLPTPACSWNALGHRLVTQIALNHMTCHAQRVFNHYSHALDRRNKSQGLVDASTWLDRIRSKYDGYYNGMHYIDIPFSLDRSQLPSVPPRNAVWAVETAIYVLQSKTASTVDKGIAVRILLHVVGDIHQPLHATTQVSAAHPKGDLGGNLVVLVQNPVAKNLHTYWDKGGGFLNVKGHQSVKVKKLAKMLEQRWPCNPSLADTTPMHWAKESRALAINTVYRFPKGNKLDKHYQRVAKYITKQRIALAGCRLAAVMNQIDQHTRCFLRV